MDAAEPNEDRDHLPFLQHHAFIIGINAYEMVSPLQTAADDARKLAEVLGAQQHFLVHPPLLDAKGAAIRTLLERRLPEQVGKGDRVLFYFAGHGIAADGDDGPTGYIVPADADPTDLKTFIPMADLQQALDQLPCRHLLLILDCCFSGAFKWSSQYRAIGTFMPKKIYKERFDRFIHDPAWQVITSAAYDQKALDVVRGIGKATGERGIAKSNDNVAHSPFAKALFEGLAGAADAKGDVEGDGVITATELYSYIRDQVEPETIQEGQTLRQTPGFFPLKKHDKGEFIFLHPRHRLNLSPIPKRSPYKGLESFNEDDQLLFYGRDRVIKALRAQAENNKLLVVSGASGTGKSSVIKAGLLPMLRAEGFRILPVIRPGAHPLAELEQALADSLFPLSQANIVGPPDLRKSILLIDQFEEVMTRCADPDERRQFDTRLRRLLDEDASIHRIILTVRADFEPQLNSGALKADWTKGRYTVPPFSLEELKEVIVMPTIQEVLIFDPPKLVDEIIAEVVQAPGALPLLSFALSELYEAYRASGRQDRALKEQDYKDLGGVVGALSKKVDSLYQGLQPAQQSTMRKLMLRMVSVEGDVASRRAPMDDLDYSDAERPLVDEVVEKLVDARLIVKGQDYIEPAHDALVRAWKRLYDWVHEVGKEKLLLATKLSAAANEFTQSGNREFLWNNNPNLPVVEKELKNPGQWFNAKEIAFIRKSVTRRKRRFRIGVVGTAAVVASLSALWWKAERTIMSARELSETIVQGIDDELRQIPNTRNAREHLFDSVGKLQQTLGKAVDKSTEFESDFMKGEIAVEGQDIDRAEVHYKRAHEKAVDQNKATRVDPAWLYKLSRSYRALGEMALLRGRLNEAKMHYDDSLGSAEKLVSAAPGAGASRNLSVSYAKLGDIARREEQFETAQAFFIKSLTAAKQTVKIAPGNNQWKNDLSITYRELADAEGRLGNKARDNKNLEGAQKHLRLAYDYFEEALKLGRKLVETEPGNNTWRRDLAATYNGRGTLKLGMSWDDPKNHQGDLKDAQRAFKASINTMELLVERDPDNHLWRDDLARSFMKLGAVDYYLNRKDDALKAYNMAVNHAVVLAKADPNNLEWKHVLISSYKELGDVESDLHHRQAAISAYGKALETAKDAANLVKGKGKETDDWRRLQSEIYEKLGDVESNAGRRDAACKALNNAVEIAEDIASSDQSEPRSKEDLEQVKIKRNKGCRGTGK